MARPRWNVLAVLLACVSPGLHILAKALIGQSFEHMKPVHGYVDRHYGLMERPPTCCARRLRIRYDHLALAPCFTGVSMKSRVF